MDDIVFAIEDLDGAALGEAKGFTVTVDINAAGQGWFVDTTPAINEEFTGEGTTRQAAAGSDAEGDMDLLTVLSHEIGHILGYQHNGSDSRVAALMDEDLTAGERILIAMPENGAWELEQDDSLDSGGMEGASLIEEGSFEALDEESEDRTFIEWTDTDTSTDSSNPGKGKGKNK